MTKSVSINKSKYGPEKLFLISGPCVIEDESIMFNTAEQLKTISEKLDIPVIFKSSFMKDNRSTVENYVGPGIDEGLKLLQKIKEQFGFPILSDIHFPEQCNAAGEVLDIIQIPAYLCMKQLWLLRQLKQVELLT